MTQTSPPEHDPLQHDVIETVDRPGSLRGFGIFVLVAALVGLTASTILIVEKIHLLANPGEALSCDLSAFVSCGGVVNQWQASVFGPPNPLFGVAGFSALTVIGVLLASGHALPRWWWAGLQVGVLFGIGFVTWLQTQSIYDIRMLCPYCLLVWCVMIPLFVVTTGQVLRQYAPSSRAAAVVNDWRGLLIALWFVGLAAAIWFQFGTTLWA